MTSKDSEVIDLTVEGWTFVMQQGAMLALMPIEDWLAAFERAEALGPILDPTLYRDYLYSGKGEIIKDVLHHALLFKFAIQRAQAKVRPDATGTNSVLSDVEPLDVAGGDQL